MKPVSPAPPSAAAKLFARATPALNPRLKRATELLAKIAFEGDRAGWRRWGAKKGVEVHLRANEASGFTDSIGQIVVDAPLEACVDALDEAKHAPQAHDANFKKLSILETRDATRLLDGYREHESSLRRYEYHAVFPTKARDMVVDFAVVISNDGKRALRALASAPPSDLPAAAADGNYVRMDVELAGYAFESLGPSKTRITSVVMMDPRGFVPKLVVNAVAVDRPMGLAKLAATPAIKDPATWP